MQVVRNQRIVGKDTSFGKEISKSHLFFLKEKNTKFGHGKINLQEEGPKSGHDHKAILPTMNCHTHLQSKMYLSDKLVSRRINHRKTLSGKNNTNQVNDHE